MGKVDVLPILLRAWLGNHSPYVLMILMYFIFSSVMFPFIFHFTPPPPPPPVSSPSPHHFYYCSLYRYFYVREGETFVLTIAKIKQKKKIGGKTHNKKKERESKIKLKGLEKKL